MNDYKFKQSSGSQNKKITNIGKVSLTLDQSIRTNTLHPRTMNIHLISFIYGKNKRKNDKSIQ